MSHLIVYFSYVAFCSDKIELNRASCNIESEVFPVKIYREKAKRLKISCNLRFISLSFLYSIKFSIQFQILLCMGKIFQMFININVMKKNIKKIIFVNLFPY